MNSIFLADTIKLSYTFSGLNKTTRIGSPLYTLMVADFAFQLIRLKIILFMSGGTIRLV